MSLRFYFGPSDGALSRKVYKDIIQRSLEQPDQNFLILVPDQFTMQTQKELALLHPRGGILNIDVLSFGRLGHRVLEEVGSREIPVLDDTGKSLVLQKIAAPLKDQLPVLGGYLNKQGYIHEVKSAVSEFMQYGLSPEKVEELIAFSGEKSVLAEKLKDLKTLYVSFLDYIRDHFVTAEETLDVLSRNLSKSAIVKDSVIVLDGFTGFTPIQYRLLQELALTGKELILTMVCGREEDPYRPCGEQNLFYLTKKTVADLEKMAKTAGIFRERSEDVVMRDEGGAEPQTQLAFLENHLFRYGGSRETAVWQGDMKEQQLYLYEASNPAEEVHQTALQMEMLVREKGYAYRDFVLISGDLEGYAPYVEAEFERLGIPCFIDRTRGITLNPLTEFIQSALEVFLGNFSYEAVFHYLRSGMSGIPVSDIDRLENYVLALGIKGQKAYRNRFAGRTKGMDPQDEAPLEALNRTRETFLSQIEVLKGNRREKACSYVDRLYDFLTAMDTQKKLESRASAFEAEGDYSRAKEYTQIYRLVMELLNQIYGLLGEEEITLQEFADILEAGFGEIQVGMIPQNVDRVLVGDMERTRFKPTKVLFFLGVNDGNIPRNTSKGGIISDMEREFLAGSDYALAPTPRQQMFIQRFYLYLNMTKASEKLFLSYARQGSDGKSVRPAYLVDTMKKMFPELITQIPQNRPVLEQIITPTEGRDYLAAGLREYAGGLLTKEKEREFFTLYAAYAPEADCGEDFGNIRRRYTEAAFSRYQDSPLSREIARLIYGRKLENSVSRLEVFAGCAYRHFLQYGLTLKERQEFGFEAVDMGTVYHDVLQTFSENLEKEHRTWFDFEEDFAVRAVEHAMEEQMARYGGSVLASSFRNAYQAKRMERILIRTVLTLQKQLKKGVFKPAAYEISFRQTQELEHLGIALTAQEKMELRGRIDRVDLAEDEEHIYVKVVDYKSGDKKFDLAALYYGLQLQLVVYMNAAMEHVRQRSPQKEAVPAALLYYHVEDPMIESSGELSDEELDREILRSLRTRGIVNESSEVVDRLDGEFTDKSDVIPVERKKDGAYSARASVMSREELEEISAYVSRKLGSIGAEILDGKISQNPYERGLENACTYCVYRKVCGFDPAIPGCRRRKLEELSKEEVFEKIRQETVFE